MSSSPAKISVVIPSYNHAHLIARALQSVLVQNWPALEILVIDNHSQDNTDAIVAGFADPRIRLQKIHNDGIIAASRNAGIATATGQWVAFLDSDDWWTADKLTRCSAHFDTADLIYHNLRIVDADGKALKSRRIKQWQVKRPVQRDLLLNGNPIATSSVLVRKSVLDQTGGFSEQREIVAAEDYDLWLRIAGLTDRFTHELATLGFYLYSTQSASRRDMSRPMRAVLANYRGDLDARTLSRIDAGAAYAAGRFALQAGDGAQARRELLQSLRWGRPDIRLRSLVALGQMVLGTGKVKR